MSGTLTGKVLDTDGDPVEDVTVTVVDADTGDTTATVTTNASGDYSTGTISDGTYDVMANKRGYLRDTQSGQSVSGGTTTVPEHTIQAAGYKIRGEITDFGYGVEGIATGTEGDPVGVRGTVPNTDTGYGLSTPDDARVDGVIDATSGHTLTVAGVPALRLGMPTEGVNFEDDTAGGNVIAGYGGNRVQNSAAGATVGGGGASGDDDLSGSIGVRGNTNEVTDDFGTIGGGCNNRADYRATVGGGYGNTASGDEAAVGGGDENTASGDHSTVGGGGENLALGDETTIAGGGGYASGNKAHGWASAIGGGRDNRTGKSGTSKGAKATVPGGEGNIAREDNSFAAGHKAEAFAEGAFVWGDSSFNNVRSTTTDEFKVQAGGGAVIYSQSDFQTGVLLGSGSGSWGSVSTRTAKTNVSAVDPAETLTEVEDMDVTRWEYDSEEEAEHMGPMAEEFYERFGLGPDAKHITNVDADGVAFAAIKGLCERLEAKDERIDELEARLAKLEEQVGTAPSADG